MLLQIKINYFLKFYNSNKIIYFNKKYISNNAPIKVQVTTYITHAFPQQIFLFHFFCTTASQKITHFRESTLSNKLKADLKDLSGPGVFRVAVRHCLLATE